MIKLWLTLILIGIPLAILYGICAGIWIGLKHIFSKS